MIAELDATMGRSEDLIPEWETPRRPTAGTEVGDRFCRASSRTSEFQFPKSWTFGWWVRKKIAESQKIALIPNIWTPPSFVKFVFLCVLFKVVSVHLQILESSRFLTIYTFDNFLEKKNQFFIKICQIFVFGHKLRFRLICFRRHCLWFFVMTKIWFNQMNSLFSFSVGEHTREFFTKCVFLPLEVTNNEDLKVSVFESRKISVGTVFL